MFKPHYVAVVHRANLESRSAAYKLPPLINAEPLYRDGDELESVNPLIYDREMDAMYAHIMSAAFEERTAWGDNGPAEYMQAAWSRELRRRVEESNERERNRVLVDREYEDWE